MRQAKTKYMPAIESEKLWSPAFVNVCIANFLMACSFNLLMPSIPLYVTEVLNIPQSKTGVILASYAIALMLVRPFSGCMVDIFPRKRMLLIGFAGYTLVFFGYFQAFSDGIAGVMNTLLGTHWSLYAVTLGVFIVVRFLHGIMWGISTVSSSTLAIDVVPSARRAEGIGYYGTLQNVAMAVGPFIAIHIYYNLGFQKLLFFAIGMGVLGFLAGSLINVPPKPKNCDRPKVSLDRFFLLPAWPIFINQLLPSFAWGTVAPFVAQYGLRHGIENPGIFFLFWAGGIILSRTFAGRMVDRGHIHNVNILGMAIASAAFFVFSTSHSVLVFCGCGLVVGIGFGMMFPALQTLYVNMADNSKRGTANSTYLLGFDLGLALGMLLGGYITAISFKYLYMLDSVLCALSILIYWTVSRPLYDRKRVV